VAAPDNSLDAEVDRLLDGAVIVPREQAFEILRVKKSFGHQLMDEGILEKIKIGHNSNITVRSIKAVLKNGVPSRAKRNSPAPPATKETISAAFERAASAKPRLIVKRPT
jgi:hypothetical protein